MTCLTAATFQIDPPGDNPMPLAERVAWMELRDEAPERQTRSNCLLWSRLRSTIHHLAAGRTESTHVLLKAGDYLFWVRDERVAKPEHVRHASFALLFRSLLSCQRWPIPEKG